MYVHLYGLDFMFWPVFSSKYMGCTKGVLGLGESVKIQEDLSDLKISKAFLKLSQPFWVPKAKIPL